MSIFQNYKYIFYDLETTGQNACFDQVIRFAAKETDYKLNIIKHHNIDIKLRCDIIPHPKALLVNRLSIDQLKLGKNEYDAFKEIHSIMNQANTINIGYNSLSFDDNFLRFGFYRNLFEPYTHQYKNNNFRADLYKMIMVYYLYKKDEAITWPMPNNRLSLRLEQINAINSLYEGMSHDAEVDVFVTIELAKKLQTIDHKMWDYLISSFMVNNDKNYFEKLPDLECIDNSKYKIGVFVSNKNGLASNYASPILALCQAYENTEKKEKKYRLLRLDMYDFSEFTEDNFDKKIEKGILTKTFGEPNFILPFSDKYLRIFNEHITGLAKSNLSWLKHNPNCLEKLIQKHRNKNFEKSDLKLDLDASLYSGGFFSKEEKNISEEFHKSNELKKVAMISSLSQKDPSSRIVQIAKRILGRNFFDYLNDIHKEEHSKYLSSIFHKKPSTVDYGGKLRVDPNIILKETKELNKNSNNNSEDNNILNQLEKLIEEKIQTQTDLGF